MRRSPRHVSLVLASIAVSALGGVGSAVLPAAQSSHVFDAGNIITDSVFYNSAAMSDADIQTFLAAKESSCSTRADVDSPTCLQYFRTTTIAKSSQANLCSGYRGGLVQTAAQVIGGVARSCGVNPQVLLILLEKEQGLVTHTSPPSWRFRSATGMGCPDTAACDSQYYGFFNQVYGAARQFRLYNLHPDWYAHQAGTVNSIAYSPQPGCGRKEVYIRNQATAGLYNYTPYVPNAASLAAGYAASPDRCASYGNRNFAFLLQVWFPETPAVPSEASTAITAK